MWVPIIWELRAIKLRPDYLQWALYTHLQNMNPPAASLVRQQCGTVTDWIVREHQKHWQSTSGQKRAKALG
jgi:hypothetical protein